MKLADLPNELSGCEFGDKRLTRRAQQLADALSQYPNVSIPTALRSKADIEGCYRFFDNAKVTPEKILQSHAEATRQRISQVDFALLVQDTTELDLTRPEQQVRGAGPMDCESRRGAFVHPLIAFDVEGVALGILSQKSWVRKKLNKVPKSEKCDQRRRKPIEEKESFRWQKGLCCAEQTALACPETTCVCVGDSESDIYDVFAAASQSDQQNLRLLLGAGQSRNTNDGQDWAEAVRKTAAVGNQTVTVRARQAKTGAAKSPRSRSREARIAELQIRKATNELCRPVHAGRRLPGSTQKTIREHKHCGSDCRDATTCPTPGTLSTLDRQTFRPGNLCSTTSAPGGEAAMLEPPPWQQLKSCTTSFF